MENIFYMEFAEYIAKEHYVLANQIGKTHYWENETESKTTTQLLEDFKESLRRNLQRSL